MAHIGRRPGFWLGTAIGGVGAVIATWAIFRSSFEWFCFGTFLLGANRGATQQYRFAAAEIADQAFRSKAISLVLAGGVVSAVGSGEHTAGLQSPDQLLFPPLLCKKKKRT